MIVALKRVNCGETQSRLGVENVEIVDWSRRLEEVKGNPWFSSAIRAIKRWGNYCRWT
jgi:hypothetical protein